MVYGRILSAMTPLQRFGSMNATHDAVLEVVEYLGSAWGDGAKVAEVAKLMAMSEAAVRTCLDELVEAGLVEWELPRGSAWRLEGVPVLGEVD